MPGAKKMEFYCSAFIGWEPGVCYFGIVGEDEITYLTKLQYH